MQARRKLLFISLIVCLLSACGGGETHTTVAVSHVDSITQSAPDTLRAPMDTGSLKKDTVSVNGGR